jgi:hypothetical protein
VPAVVFVPQMKQMAQILGTAFRVVATSVYHTVQATWRTTVGTH